ncbi:hypothetical protein DAPPUDRAFT_122652, partial [Daphnia pulex]
SGRPGLSNILNTFLKVPIYTVVRGLKMVRTYYRKTEKVPREILIGALRHLKLLDNLNLQKIAYRKVAEGFGIPKSTLFSHYQKVKDLDSIPENYLSNEVHNRQILKYKEEACQTMKISQKKANSSLGKTILLQFTKRSL